MSLNQPSDSKLAGVYPTSTCPPTGALSLSSVETASRPQPAPHRRRDKPQMSCNFCRRRKLRCDRQQPCTVCSSRGLALSCTYPNNMQGSPATMQQRQAQALRPRPSVQDRLVYLEQIVASLMQNSPRDGQLMPDDHHSPAVEGPEHVGAFNDAEYSPSHSDCGSMRVSSSEFRYVGGTHWAAILDGIADLKEHFEREEDMRLMKDDADIHKTPHALLLYGCKPASKAEIEAALPPRPVVDRFISRYFNLLDLAPSALHSAQFLKEYEIFWTTPSETPVMWLGLLFSMICLAVLASDAEDATLEADRNILLETYREKTVQCLILGEYTKPGPYTFGTLYHYLTIESSIRKDADKDIWILLGIVINLAMRMGYHRDPCHFPEISPFVGEMRRRGWATVLQGDILISTQMGMPRMINDWQSDTAEPRNINDSDFDEDTKELPPSRPETEMTTVLHIVARRRIFKALGAVVDITAAVRPCSYGEVMIVDKTLHDAKATIPTYLRMKPMAASVTDPPQVIMHRLFIATMFYNGQIMLHRKYLNSSQSQGQDPFVYSRKSCLDAALGILEIQQIFDEEIRPGGQLHTMRWRLSSFTNHAFLTATMILCFLVHREGLQPFANEENLDREEKIKIALKKSHNIWIRSSNSSAEACKAADALSIVLARVSPQDTHSSHVTRPVATSSMELDSDGPSSTMFFYQDFFQAEQFLGPLAPLDTDQAGQNASHSDMGFIGANPSLYDLMSNQFSFSSQ